MNLLIAGGSGLIGSLLSNSVSKDGHRVSIVSRYPDQKHSFPTEIKLVGWTREDLVESIRSSDAVVNLAGASIGGANPFQMRWTRKRKVDILQSRLQAGAKITEAIRAASKKPEVLIQASAIGYYGNAGLDIVDETSPAGNDFLAEVCQTWEESTKDVESLGVRRVIIRIGLVFSQTGGLFQLLKLPFSLNLGGQIGSGSQYLSWIHIDDLVSAIRFLIDQRSNQGIFNITSPTPIPNKEFAHQLGRVMKKPTWFSIPKLPIRILLGEASTLALEGRKVLPKRILESGFEFRYNLLEPALRNLVNQ
jgi:uncharacterized protein (TIGR01777 family)